MTGSNDFGSCDSEARAQTTLTLRVLQTVAIKDAAAVKLRCIKNHFILSSVLQQIVR